MTFEHLKTQLNVHKTDLTLLVREILLQVDYLLFCFVSVCFLFFCFVFLFFIIEVEMSKR